jgi:hypothetical protein
MSKSTPPPRRHTKDVEIPYVHHGRQERVTVDVPDFADAGADADAEATREVAHFVQTLADNGQLDGPDATHEIVSAPDGTRRLIRRRFSHGG